MGVWPARQHTPRRRTDERFDVAAADGPNRATNVPVTIQHAGGELKTSLNQRKTPAIDRTWQSLGRFRFDKEAAISISNAGTDGYVVIDAVQLLPAP